MFPQNLSEVVYKLCITYYQKNGLYFKNKQNDILKDNKPYYLNKQINVSN